MEEVWSSGALEMRCRRVDVEVFASRALEPCYSCSEEEVWRRAAGVQTRSQRRMEIWSLEACFGPGDVASKEVWRCAAGLVRYGNLELGRRAAGLGGGVEVWRSKVRAFISSSATSPPTNATHAQMNIPHAVRSSNAPLSSPSFFCACHPSHILTLSAMSSGHLATSSR